MLVNSIQKHQMLNINFGNKNKNIPNYSEKDIQIFNNNIDLINALGNLGLINKTQIVNVKNNIQKKEELKQLELNKKLEQTCENIVKYIKNPEFSKEYFYADNAKKILSVEIREQRIEKAFEFLEQNGSEKEIKKLKQLETDEKFKKSLEQYSEKLNKFFTKELCYIRFELKYPQWRLINYEFTQTNFSASDGIIARIKACNSMKINVL